MRGSPHDAHRMTELAHLLALLAQQFEQI